MRECVRDDPRLDAYIDGELPGLEAGLIRRHLDACAPCRAAEKLQRDFLAMVRVAAAGSPSIPNGLENRVRAALRPSPSFAFARARAVIFASVVAVMFGAGAVVRMGMRDRAAAAAVAASTSAIQLLATVAANEHVLRLGPGAPLEIETADARALARWAQERVPFGVVLPAFDNPGLEAVGARITRVGVEPALSAAYRIDGEPVTLLVTGTAIDGSAVESGESFRGLRFHLGYQRGFRTITWTDKGLSYVLVSSIGEDGRQACSICHGPGSGRRPVHQFWE